MDKKSIIVFAVCFILKHEAFVTASCFSSEFKKTN